MKINNQIKSGVVLWKRARMWALLFVMASLVMTLAAQTKRTAEPAAEAEFKAIIKEYYAAWNTMNAANAAKYYAKDADIVFYDIAPLKYTGWEEYRDSVNKNFFGVMTSARLTPNDDLQVRQRGDVAWTALTFHLSTKPKAGAAAELECRHTAIWEKRGGRWLIVHEHVSAPLPQ